MTFSVALASRTAIWVCADRQLIDRRGPRHSSKSGIKITEIHTDDGVALLAYTGLGRVLDTQVSHWVSRTLRGRNLKLEQSLEHVAGAALRRLAPYVKRYGTSHTFIAAAIRDRMHHVYVVDLLKKPPQVMRGDPRTKNEVALLLTGSGMIHARQHEQARMKRIKHLVKPYERGVVSAEFIASQLAALNISVSAWARKKGDESVSAESIVVHRHPNSKKSGGAHWCFGANGRVDETTLVIVPAVVGGYPASAITEVSFPKILEGLRALPPGATANQKLEVLTRDYYSQAIADGRISLKPDEEFH